MDWLWQALVANSIWEWILVPAVGVMLAILRKKNPNWAGTVIYGLGGSAFVAMILFALIGRPILSKQRPPTSRENIEANLKSWSDTFSLGIQKQTDDKFNFVYRISLPSGRAVLVGNPKQREGYLQFQGNVILGPEHEAALKKLSSVQLERIFDEINLQMAIGKVGFGFVNGPTNGMFVSKAIPISSSLNESSFVGNLDEMDNALLLAREAIRLAFAHNGVMNVTPRPSISQ